MEQRLQLLISAQITFESQNWVAKERVENRVMGHVDRVRTKQVFRDYSHWELCETYRYKSSFKNPSDTVTEAAIMILKDLT